MNPPRSSSEACDRALDQLDRYLDRQLGPDASAEVAQHLHACPSCSSELQLRSALRARLKTAVTSVTVTPELQHRIRRSLRAESRRPQWAPRGAMLAAAAALIMTVGLFVTYSLGHLRLTTASQERYIASISQHVAGIMRVGLGDHVHCAVFRKLSKEKPSLEQMTHDMGPQYKDLIDVVKGSIANDYELIGAHQCRYHGRRFVHVSATNGSRLISLVISRKGQGESFTRDEIAPVLSQSGIQLYQSGVQRFEIAGFETRDHLVYIVSDLGAQKNLQLMIALAPGVRDVLHRIEA